METEQMLEALVTAIKESSKPTAELAQMLKHQITPVAQSRLRSVDVSKIAVNKDTAYEVSGGSVYNMVSFLTIRYGIKNEICTDAGCVKLEKGMLFEYDGCEYTLTQVSTCKDDLFVTFALKTDAVLIQ